MTVELPRGWRLLSEGMRERGWQLNVFWNPAGRCFSARIIDRAGQFAPPEAEGDVLAAGGPTPVDAMQAVARIAERVLANR